MMCGCREAGRVKGYFDLGINCLFLLDIVITFRTPYTDKQGVRATSQAGQGGHLEAHTLAQYVDHRYIIAYGMFHRLPYPVKSRPSRPSPSCVCIHIYVCACLCAGAGEGLASHRQALHPSRAAAGPGVVHAFFPLHLRYGLI